MIQLRVAKKFVNCFAGMDMFIDKEYDWYIESLCGTEYHILKIDGFQFYVFDEDQCIKIALKYNNDTFKYITNKLNVIYYNGSNDGLNHPSIEEGKLLCEKYYENGGCFVPKKRKDNL